MNPAPPERFPGATGRRRRSWVCRRREAAPETPPPGWEGGGASQKSLRAAERPVEGAFVLAAAEPFP